MAALAAAAAPVDGGAPSQLHRVVPVVVCSQELLFLHVYYNTARNNTSGTSHTYTHKHQSPRKSGTDSQILIDRSKSFFNFGKHSLSREF